MPNNDTWWVKWRFDLAHHWRFGLVLAGLLIGFEMLMAGVFILITPHGQQWLGSMVFNAFDQAVYLNYLLQGKDGLSIYNLFNDLPQVPRFDVFWSTGGLLVKAGLSPILTHEILRWLMTMVLAFAVFATAKSLFIEERKARLSSLLMLSGLSLGTIYAGWRDLGGPKIQTTGPLPPDLVTEFGIAPIPVAGAHIILSVALEILVVRWIYELICLGERKRLAPCFLAALVFSWLHPYFIALMGCQLALCLVAAARNGRFKTSVMPFLIVCLSLVPSTIYHSWLAYQDRAFKVHFLDVNVLPLGSPWGWLFTLLPLLWALGYAFFRRQAVAEHRPADIRWVWYWIVSAVICILLPFPWKRKYTQGLLMAGVILTLPYWLMVCGWLRARWKTGVKHLLLLFCFLLFAVSPYLYLFVLEFETTAPIYSLRFYQGADLMEAWRQIRNSPGPDMLLTDNFIINLWVPAQTGKHVWVGHSHETPNYSIRFKEYADWLGTQDPIKFNRYLDQNPITRFIVTERKNIIRFETMIDRQNWERMFSQGSVAVWTKRR